MELRTMKRPTSMTVIAWLAIVAGALEAFLSTAYFGLSSLFLGAVTVTPLTSSLASFSFAIGISLLVLGVLAVVFGIGALSQRSWAWMLGIVTFALTAIAGVSYMLILGVAGVTVASVLGLVLSIAIVAYLFTETGREALGHSHHMDASSTHMTPA
jgi:hypothetical protein